MSSAEPPPTSLFRPQALAAARRRLWGELLLTQPPGTGVLAGLVVAALLAAAALLVWGEGRRSERVEGYLSPAAGLVRVRAPQGGRVAAVFVREGAEVAAGDPLVEIRDPRADGGTPRPRSLSALDAELARVDALRGAARERFAQEAAAVAGALERSDRRRRALEDQLAVAQRERALAQRAAERAEALAADGWLSAQLREQAQRDALAVAREYEAVRLALVEAEDRAGALEARRAALGPERTVRLAELEDRRDRLVRERAELAARLDFLLRAPRAGRVVNLAVVEGDSAAPGRVLLSLLPEGDAMEAVLLVPSRAIGFVRPGQTVRLRYDAFPATRFGAQAGEVLRVPGAAVAPAELEGPVAPREPVYPVRVRPAGSSFEAYGRPQPLQAGMRLEAEIELERRSLLAWLLEPLLAVRGRL